MVRSRSRALTQSVRLLDEIGWWNTDPPAEVPLDLRTHRLVVTRALETALLLADADMKDLDAERARRFANRPGARTPRNACPRCASSPWLSKTSQARVGAMSDACVSALVMSGGPERERLIG